MQMIQLIYISIQTRPLGTIELESILEVSRRNNLAQDITGLLILKNQYFMQALEGEKGAVQTLYKKVKQDPRHTDISIISQEEISHRSFSGWTMGFKNLNTLSPVDSQKLINFADADLTTADFAAQPSAIMSLFQAFVETP